MVRITELNQKTLELYTACSLIKKLLIRRHFLTLQLEQIDRIIPPDGRILELGCGRGLPANWLWFSSPKRNILGIDKSTERIADAQKTIGDRQGIRFAEGDIFRISESIGNFQFDTILIYEVLYLLEYQKHESVLSDCFRILPIGGFLIIKDYDREPLYKYVFFKCQSTMVNITARIFELCVRRKTGVFGAHRGGPYIRHHDKYLRLLEAAGFAVEHHDVSKGSLYPRAVFVAKKIQN